MIEHWGKANIGAGSGHQVKTWGRGALRQERTWRQVWRHRNDWMIREVNQVHSGFVRYDNHIPKRCETRDNIKCILLHPKIDFLKFR